jgi:hypothetical protein
MPSIEQRSLQRPKPLSPTGMRREGLENGEAFELEEKSLLGLGFSSTELMHKTRLGRTARNGDERVRKGVDRRADFGRTEGQPPQGWSAAAIHREAVGGGGGPTGLL